MAHIRRTSFSLRTLDVRALSVRDCLAPLAVLWRRLRHDADAGMSRRLRHVADAGMSRYVRRMLVCLPLVAWETLAFPLSVPTPALLARHLPPLLQHGESSPKLSGSRTPCSTRTTACSRRTPTASWLCSCSPRSCSTGLPERTRTSSSTPPTQVCGPAGLRRDVQRGLLGLVGST